MLLSSLGSALALSYVKVEIIEKIEGGGESVGDESGARIFRLDDSLGEEIYENDKKASVLRIGGEKIGPSVFLGMVASFDALIVDIVGRLIQQNPSRFTSSEKAIPVIDLLTADSLESIIQKFISEELFRFSRESHDAQTVYIEKQFGVTIRESWKRYHQFIEVFERRNLVAHGEPSFNERYAKICASVGFEGIDEHIGKKLDLKTSYQKQAIYILSEYAILMAFVLWRKHAPDREFEAFATLNEAAYKLTQNGHFKLAERILDFALSLKNVNVSEEVRKMMVVNHASAVGGRDGNSEVAAVLDKHDWSASALQYKLSVAALKQDVKLVTEIAPQAHKLGFSMTQYRTWPVFRFIRDDKEFNDTLAQLYGERLVEADRVVERKDEKGGYQDTAIS